MKSIWVIEHGDYDDHAVLGVYSSEKNAQIMVDYLGYGDTSITEWKTNPGIEELNKGYTLWNILMFYDGTVESCKEESYHRINNSHFLFHRHGVVVKYGLSSVVWAKDSKHAIKIANEKRLQMIANGEWAP